MIIDQPVVNVRYIVSDVQAALDFYTEHLGFSVLTTALPAFADVRHGNLRLILSGPTSSGGRPLPDGSTPVPGGCSPPPPRGEHGAGRGFSAGRP